MIKITALFLFVSILLAPYLRAETPQKSLLAILNLSTEGGVEGEECRQGLEIGLRRTPISITWGDHAGSSTNAISEFYKNSPSDFLFITRSGPALAISKILEHSEIPLLVLAATPKILPRLNTLRVFPSAERLGEAFAQEIGNIATSIITTEDEYTEAVSAATIKKITPLSHLSIPKNSSDSRGIITKALLNNPSGVLLNVSLPQYPALLRALSIQGFQGRVFANGWLSFNQDWNGVNRAMLNKTSIVDVTYPTKQLSAELNRQPPSTLAYYCTVAGNAIAAFEQQHLKSFSALTKLTVLGEPLNIHHGEVQYQLTARPVIITE